MDLQHGRQNYGSPSISSDGTIYIGSYDKKVYAINPDGTLKWTYTTGGSIYYSCPAIGADGTIYIGSSDSKLYAINPDGTLKWTYTTGGSMYFSPPTIGVDGTIYVGSFGGKVYAINPDGTLKWTYNTGSAFIYSSAVIATGGTIYIGDYNGKLYAISPNGSLKWTYTIGGSDNHSSPTIGADGTIYIGTKDGNIYALTPNGSLKWTYTTGGSIYSTPSIGADGTLYIGSCDNKLYAFKTTDVVPSADFIADKNTGGVPITVQFTDKSQHATSWAWDFNSDGNIDSTEQNPTFTYTTPGNYTVILTASNSLGNSTKTLPINLSILSPVANFSTTQTSGTSPYTVHFTDKSVYATSWTWDFDNDGIIDSTEQNPTYTYNKTPGYYTVSLAVTGPGGNDNLTKTNYILIVPHVNISVTGGTYNTTQNITLTSDDTTATIYYTLDGTNPQTSTTKTLYNGNIIINEPKTLRYAAVSTTGNWSPLYLQYYLIGTEGLANTDWPEYQNNNNNTGQSSYIGPQTNNLNWTYTTGNEIYSSPAIAADGTIYIGSTDGNLYAINPEGTLKWTYTTGSSIYYSSPAIGADGTIYIGSNDGKLYAINPEGTLKWTYTTGGSIYYSSSTIGSDGTIYIGSSDKKIYAINPDGTLKWNYTTGSTVDGVAIGSDGTIYAGSMDKNLYALNSNGTLKWTYTTGGTIWSSPSIGADGTIYIGSDDKKLYAINPDGTLKWTYTTGSSIHGSAAICTDGTIYIGSQDGYVYALNPDGTLKWKYSTGDYVYDSAAIASDGTIYIGSWSKKIYAITSDGTLKWLYTTGSSISGSAAIDSDGTLYIGSCDKKLYAFKDLAADLSTTVTVDNQTPKLDDNLNITITTKNNGPGTAFNTFLTYILPEGLEYISATVFNGTVSYDATNRLITWNLGNLGLVNATMNILTHVIASGTYNITPDLTTITRDSNETNNIGSVIVSVLGPVFNTRTNTAYNTIQAAIDDENTLNGDTILVGSGIYTENITVNKQITIKALKDAVATAADVNRAVFSLTSDSIINGFTITGATNSCGIYVSPSASATITNNTITGNKIGIQVDNGTANIHFNNIYNNTLYGLKFTGTGVNATNNWWGTNNPTYQSGVNAPGKTDIYEAQNENYIVHSPWIVLTVNSSDDLLTAGEKSIINIDMTHNTWGQDTSDEGNIPETPINFNYTLGTLTTTNTTVSRGKSNTTITAGNTSGKEDLTTTVTGYTINTPITVDTVAPTVNNSLTGGTYNTTQTVTLTTDDPTATIYYANDTTDPRNSTTRIQYTGPITISNTTTLRYAAVDPAGNWSPLYLQNYVIGTGGLANSPQPEFQNNNNHTGQSSYTGPETAAIQWVYTTGGGIYSYGSPTIGSDGTIYVGSAGVLYAINPDGTIKWNYTTGTTYTIRSSPAIGADGTIYFGINGISGGVNFFAVNPDGTLKWNYTTNYPIQSSPAIGEDGTIYIGTYNGGYTGNNFYALNSDGTLKWSATIGSLSYSSPALDTDGTIYIGGENGYLYAINPDGTIKWNYKAIYSSIRSSPSIGSDGTIYFTQSNYLYAVNPDGTLKWTYNGSGSSWSTPAISNDGTIYFGMGKSAYAVNPDGTLKWTYNTGSTMYYTSAAIGADGTIYIGAYTVYAFNPDGTLKWSVGSGQINSVAIGSDGTLYFGSNDKNIYAVSNQVANFTTNATIDSDPLTVHFTDTSTGNVTSWAWDFQNDGIVDSTEQNPTYAFTTALGTSTVYSVKLTVNTTSGSSSLVKLNYITVYALTAVNFTSNATTGQSPLTVQFTDKSAGYNMTSWSWDFGDGSTSNLQNPAHTYTAPGNYTVTLTVTNPAGSNSLVMSNYITVPVPAVPVASFTVNDTWGVNSTTVQFTDTSLGNNITSWFWDFGDGTNSTLQNPTHNYTVVGNYTVSLTVANSEGNSTRVKTSYIIVRDGEADPLTNNRHIFINVANDDGVLYDYDGKTYSGPSNTYYIKCDGGGMNALHITNNPSATGGQITNSNNPSGVLWVTNTGGNGYSDDIILLISVQGTISDDFSVTIISSGYVFTPGVTSTATYVVGAVNETFTKEDFFYGPQIYKPGSGTLGVWSLPLYSGQQTSDNTTASYLMFIDLKVGTMQSGTDNGGAKVEFSFNNMTTIASFNAYSWCLSSNQGQGISWTNNPGSSGYIVTYVAPPVANFTVSSTNGTSPLTVHFTDTSSNYPTSWAWDFNGDGIIDSTHQNPTWTYTSEKNYTVTLTADNNGGNNTITKTDYITVNWPIPVANFTANTTNGLDPLTVQFTDTSTGNITSWAWDFNGDGVTDSTEQNPTWTYSISGIYTVILTVSGPGGNNNLTQTDYITVFNNTPPTVNTNPEEGVYNGTQTIKLTSEQSGITIYYTTDGTDPQNSTNRIAYTDPIQIYTTTTLRFVAVNQGGVWSQKYSKTYNIDTVAPTTNVNLQGGLFNTAQSVTIAATDNLDPNPTIYYTTDGSDPTTSSTQYTGPINIGTTTTLKFMSIDAAGNQGNVQTEIYNISSDVYVQITPSITNPTVGDKVTYTFKLGNNGPGEASNVVFTYVIPEGVEYAGANVDQGTVNYDETTRTLTWTVGNVAAGVDPYLWLNLNILSAGTFNILPTVTVDGYNPGLNNNIGTLHVNTSPKTSTVNAASPTNTETVNATTTTQTIPMKTTGMPITALISALIMIGTGLAMKMKK